MSEKKIAIIPARGGSKRIPKKNIKDFLGKPIIAYSIELAIKCQLFDEIMVSTDDVEIAEVSEKFGANVPFMRSAKNSSDRATTLDVINEVLDFYKKKNNNFLYGCCIYPTSPLIQEDHLIQGYKKLKDHYFDTVFPVVPFSYPIWRGFEIKDRGKGEMIWPEYINSRSQDLKQVYHDAGQWYWFNTKLVKSSLFAGNNGCISLLEEQVHDIDNASDWIIAEMKYHLLYGRQYFDKG